MYEFELGLFLGIVLILLVLAGYGFIKWADITSSILPPATATATPAKPNVAPMASNAVGSEVFHVSDNQFTYNDAPAVCAAYGAQLATLEQVMDAYNHGAEWCGYGWTVGGMALYPTQKATWTALQVEVDPAKRTACGRPGVNGGYFDPASKFGVNCYGFKPLGKADLPLPPPGTDPATFSGLVNRFKSALKTFNMAPYSRTEWSGYITDIELSVCIALLRGLHEPAEGLHVVLGHTEAVCEANADVVLAGWIVAQGGASAICRDSQVLPVARPPRGHELRPELRDLRTGSLLYARHVPDAPPGGPIGMPGSLFSVSSRRPRSGRRLGLGLHRLAGRPVVLPVRLLAISAAVRDAPAV